eukprot:CAMPEP_0176007162 /NCGR_PEP_ID=MMETSP0120_2-20121206/3091_1 /TAXON_ID=160619 /ORGANISM="Kryptoperidinium foliaceum, Strain CCMP 1326" /LENGTH=1059 /DNA_ID=CAMNT_0017339915 /DNA_START=393 /DNA_END=3569 /DNA_ORIENTATION=+
MPPREASGVFPDNYITFDFEAGVGVGAPPVVHEPFPNNPNNGPMGDAGGVMNEDDNNNNTGTLTDAPHADNGHNPARPSPSAVDPLSIDPTTAWDFTNTSTPALPDLSMGSMRTTVRNTAATSASSRFHMQARPRLVVSPQSSTASSSVSGFHHRGVQSADSSLSDTSMSPGLDDTYDSLQHQHPQSVSSSSISAPPNMMMVVEDDQSAAQLSSSSSNTSRSTNNIAMLESSQAFDSHEEDEDDEDESPSSPALVAPSPTQQQTPTSPNSILLSFGPNTTVSDLKYFAERGCIVALLQALTTPRLVTLGTRMLADYAKMSHRRVAVASNKRILEFVQNTMLSTAHAQSANGPQESDWLGREYAVETVRSLTATEESDQYLMGAQGLLPTLALVARGGPYIKTSEGTTMPLASEKARLHACIAIMNLSCGKANKIEIAKIPQVLEAMRDVMLHGSPEACLKATTCIKNLSNADANDAALLQTPGLVQALGHVAATTCSPEHGATPCTTNACLALMNLSISKANKHRVFQTRGVMDALMLVLERTTAQGNSTEARIKACSALSNLAIGYSNKSPMFHYPGFVESILNVIQTDTGEARTKACSILWSFAAEMKNQVPVVRRGDILPVLVQVAEEDGTTEARFKCVAALTLLAESLENAIPLLQSGALAPLMEILHEAGPDPTQWKGQTASWCVGFLMNIAQADEAVPALREAGVVELLAPLLTLDHYQSLKAAMAVTFCCRFDEGDECYDLLRKTENVIPKIISLLHNTLSGRGGNGYKYGVFTLRSSVGCIAALASGPDFMKERIATGPVFESLLRVLSDFCVDGGTPGAIVGGGRDDVLSATLAVRATQALTAHLIPITGCSALPFGQSMEERLLTALKSFEDAPNEDLPAKTRALATDAKLRIEGSRKASRSGVSRFVGFGDSADDVDMNDVASLASKCCGLQGLPGFGESFLGALTLPDRRKPEIVSNSSLVEDDSQSQQAEQKPVRTFLLADSRTGRRFAVPTDPSGGRSFNDNRVWCYRRGRFCHSGEQPDPNFIWTEQLQQAYEEALSSAQEDNS